MNSQKKENHLIVLIPTLNEEKAIGNLVEKCLKYTDNVILVDGLSTDLTVQKAKDKGAEVLFCEDKGKGKALLEGFTYLLNNRDFSHIVYMDGDYTYDPDDIPKLVKTSQEHHEYDLVIGNRFPLREKGTITKLNMVGNRFFSFLVSLIIRQRITDTQSGLRLITRKSTEFFSSHLESQNFEIETEMIMKASKARYKIGEVPVNFYKRKGEKTHRRPRCTG